MGALRGCRVAGLALLAACAHVEPPTGGPEDEAPPVLVTSRPDSMALVPGWSGPVVLAFDERLSERGIEPAVLVSPLTSPARVDHRGSQIRVELRGGWRPGTIYQVTLLPEVQDLFQNRLREPVRVVFSTGPEIPATAAVGEVRDPITGKPEAGARVEAILLGDSLVYAVRSDSAGRFRIANVPAGEYRIRAYPDQNRNRALDPFEPRDTARALLAVGDTANLELGILMPDSTPPRVATARVEGGAVRVEFDDYLDPAQPLPPERVEIVGPEGTPVPVAALTVGAPAPARAAGAPADTARPAEPRPAQTLTIRLADDARLVPRAEYRVRLLGIRNLLGLAADAETTFQAPEAPSPPPPGPVRGDTARAARSPSIHEPPL